MHDLMSCELSPRRWLNVSEMASDRSRLFWHVDGGDGTLRPAARGAWEARCRSSLSAAQAEAISSSRSPSQVRPLRTRAATTQRQRPRVSTAASSRCSQCL